MDHDLQDYRICSRCILDTDGYPEIIFDDKGVCNICKTYDEMASKTLFDGNESGKRLLTIIDGIKKQGRHNKYDCVLGASGGIDSTYLAYRAKNLGLNPLVVHLDNGWNSELAVNNIMNMTKKLDLDLFTYVINWNEFRDLQVAYLKASVVDIEAVSDHAIISTLFKIARKFRVKYILSGENTVTEGIMPPGWVHNKSDYMNIKAIHKKFGTMKIGTYPHLSYYSWFIYLHIFKIRNVKLLNYLDYNKESAKLLISDKLGWRDYGGKHYESLFTKFYQSYILPSKFRIDKRKSHLSTLICSGQISRDDALNEIRLPLYEEEKLKEDKLYVLKKLELTEKEFDLIMQLPVVQHTHYRSIINFYDRLFKIRKLLSARYS